MLKTVYLEKNGGLGNSLRIAIDNCSYDLVARMDSDDISYPGRFKKQLDYFSTNPETDLVSGFITEFIGVEDNITGQRRVPETNDEIYKDMKKRCAINHVACMYKKDAVLKAGGYKDWYYNEDYFLWIRMMLSNAVFGNIQDNLVNVRVGADMSARRGGHKYFHSEVKLQRYMLSHGIINLPRYLYNVFVRFVGELLVPNWVRRKLFKFTREKVEKEQFIKDMTIEPIIDNVDYPPFSVAMSVYKNDNPDYFDLALASLFNQTVKPNEIVLVVDGPVPESIEKVIQKYKSR